MSLDRTTLSKISRKLTSGLDVGEEWRMVRVPASEGVWSAWKQYCSTASVSMGRALAGLIENELRSLVGTSIDRDSVFDVDRHLRERDGDSRSRAPGRGPGKTCSGPHATTLGCPAAGEQPTSIRSGGEERALSVRVRAQVQAVSRTSRLTTKSPKGFPKGFSSLFGKGWLRVSAT